MIAVVFILQIIGLMLFALSIHLLDLMLKRTGETIGFKFKNAYIPYLTLLFITGILIVSPYFKKDFINAFNYENYNTQMIIIWSMFGINFLWIIFKLKKYVSR